MKLLYCVINGVVSYHGHSVVVLHDELFVLSLKCLFSQWYVVTRVSGPRTATNRPTTPTRTRPCASTAATSNRPAGVNTLAPIVLGEYTRQHRPTTRVHSHPSSWVSTVKSVLLSEYTRICPAG